MKNIRSLPILFLSLCLPSLAGAQAGTTLLVKTDMSCNWKLDGRPMDLLKADDPKVVLVSPGEHLIEASTTDAVATTRTKVEVNKIEKTVSIQLKSRYAQQLKMQHDDAARIKAGAALTPTWTDQTTGLMWAREDNGFDVDWRQASAYCSEMKLAGYTDWRLPTFDELQAIHDRSVVSKFKFDHDDTYNVHVKGNLTLTGWTWSSTLGDGPGQPWQEGYLVNFGYDPLSHQYTGYSGTHNFMTYTYSMRALCMRRVGE